MADYVKTNWEDNKTPVNAENLNNIEDGIKKNEQDIDAVEEDVVEAKSVADQAQKEVDAVEEDVAEIRQDIGDIDSALDELHNYAQNLISGGGDS